MPSNLTIREPMLRELVQLAAVEQATIKGTKSGFSVIALVGPKEKVLETARGETRLFASLDTVASFVHELGLPRFEVDMSEYQPGRLRKPRPDRAEALKKTRTRLKQKTLEI